MHKLKPKWKPKTGIPITQTVCTNIIQEKPLPPVCPQCIYRDSDVGKYDMASYGGRRFVTLKSIAATMLICPKCGLTYVTMDFINEKAVAKIRKRKMTMRMQQLKAMYS